MSARFLSSTVNVSTSAKCSPTKAKEAVFVPFAEGGFGSSGATPGKHHAGYIEPIHSKVFKLALSIPFRKGSVFTIGDYGAADAQFQVIHEDQGENDFNSLFRRLTGIIPEPPSYLLTMDNVYAFACGTDFYKQCVPSNSMHFIMCMMSVHWLSQLPTVYRDSIYVYYESLKEEKVALRRQAQADWEKFLLMRSRELREGGVLFVGSPAAYMDQKTCRLRHYGEKLVTLMTDVWKSFTISGKIARHEFINTNFPCCLRNTDQIREPFEIEGSQVLALGQHLLPK
ncbi:uncharacterized protein [Haliotis asinina]|uniref:uncharacterized protein n=1 Tax=Haliotis asinina TaxID=109174 RepID=UPI0035320A99